MRKFNEERLQSLEEAREDALEVAQEEDEEKEARPEDAEEVSLGLADPTAAYGGMG